MSIGCQFIQISIGCEVFHNLKAVIKAKFGGDATLIGDEGGFAPPCSVDSGLEMLMEAIDKAGHSGVCTVIAGSRITA